MKKFRRSIMGNKSQEIARPEVVSVHLESASTVLDDLRGQATWEEEWIDNNPNMVSVSNHERKVHLLSDLLGKAEGVLAFREVLDLSPALKALMSEAGGAGGDPMAIDESKHQLVGGKLGEGDKFKGDATAANGGGENAQLVARGTSTQEFYHHRDRLRSLLELEENAACADCSAKLPTWASVNTGVFLCTQCAGCHRSLGVHISKVLSVQLDDWAAEQVKFMAEMGNGMANSFLEYHVPSAWPKPSHLEPRDYRDSYIKAKYQDRLFEFRGQKKPIMKPPPAVDQSANIGDSSGSGGLERKQSLSQGMTEYIGFVNIVLVRGEDLVPAGFGQLQYMAVLRIGGQEVRSRWAKADGTPSWSEKLMLCWDGSMPLNIDVYGGKDHIGQAQVPLRKLLLNGAEDGCTTPAPAAAAAASGEDSDATNGLSPATRLLDSVMATPSSAYNGRSSSSSSGGFAANGGGEDNNQPERRPSMTPSSSLSSPTSEPPTLGSLSSAAATPVAPPLRTTPTARLMNATGSGGGASASTSTAIGTPEFSALEASPAAAIGGGGGSGGRASMSTSPVEGSIHDGVFVFAGNSFKNREGGDDAGGSGGGGGGKKQMFVQPVPSSMRVGGLLGKVKGPAESTSSSIEELSGGELFVTLEDKKDAAAVDRLNGLSPMTGTGSVGSSRGASPRPPGSMGKLGGSFNGTGNLSTKSFNNMISKLGKGGGSSGGGGPSGQSQQGRPAQGGVVIKMDLVLIEH